MQVFKDSEAADEKKKKKYQNKTSNAELLIELDVSPRVLAQLEVACSSASKWLGLAPAGG